ncbi:MAG TPA: isoprenylcysteine carboxylmethyltransferase family protein [Leptospiraceae bacterium]|nr:isoprenylcysteine carboxylmethyltransferase family protein [Leptospiraceae bacterium]HMZ35020.1 isoprenylcysteine carboxylmethyltransferase family protein [Leptospiraceae bacterium]HNJ03449.1 isoprenylcysteine carboxylmethyltransferase family protein [Leptospiraceae bacterium]
MPIFLATRKDTGCMVAVKTMLEFCFKIATLLLTLFYAAVRSIYQYRYNQKHKKRRVHFLRESFLVTLVAVCWWGSTGLYVFTNFLENGSFHLHTIARIAGGCIMFASIVYFWRVHSFLGKHWSPVLEIEHEHTIIETGPFRTVRHPMYSAIIVSILSQGLLTANLFVLIPSLVSFLFLCWIRIPAEEKMLEEEFGEEYAKYKSRTWIFFPWVL